MVDDRLWEIKPVPDFVYQNHGLQWYNDIEQEYLVNELLGISSAEMEEYVRVSNELYRLFQEVGADIIKNRSWKEAGIPTNMVPLIEWSWARRDTHPHLYGRFDISGIIDGRPPKLIEFNADTATILPETGIIQLEQLQENGLPPNRQFNALKEHLISRFQLLLNKNPNKHASLLISTLGSEEDRLNADFLAQAAEEAGFVQVQQLDLDKVIFSPDEGIFSQMGADEFIRYDFFCKLIPWEFLADEEPDLLSILFEMMESDLAIIVNPAYSLLYQSKGTLKLLWEYAPEHPLLLPAESRPDSFAGKAYVEKVWYGREGENIRITDANGVTIAANGGEFGHYPRVYQAYQPLPRDEDGDYYQAGVYWSGKPCALSYRRRDGLIIDEDAEFIGHYLMEE